MAALRSLLRYVWASPASVVGLCGALIATVLGATWRRVDGVLEVGGGALRPLLQRLPRGGRFCAITFGHVVIGLDHATLADSRLHEHVHVRQYERWGVLFFPLYVGSSLLQWLRGRDPYRDNRFEREAFQVASMHASASRR